MQFEVGDKVIWRKDGSDPGIIEIVDSQRLSIRWKKAGLLSYSKAYFDNLTIIEKNKSEFKTLHVVKLEDFTGTVVEYKGRKYKLCLAE